VSRPIEHQWKAMFHYLHDPIISNRCKEILYKLYTQVLPVGTNIEKFGKPKNCCFCDDEENEFHLFICCPRIERLWFWLYDFVLRHYDNVISNDLTDWEKPIGFNEKMPRTLSQVWKIFHAETIRTIWASRCRLVFVGELMKHEELQAQIGSRVEYAMTIWANILQASIRQRKILKKIVRIWTVTIPIASFEKIGKGF
jgi:hypothetical protein